MRNRSRCLRFIGAALAGVISTVALGHGQVRTDADEARHIDFPDTGKYLTLVVDLHTHSVFSDGHVWPNVRVAEALLDGLDALAITEHLEYQPHQMFIPHPDRNVAFDEAVQGAVGTDLIVVAGSEITREAPDGHMNAVFITDANALWPVGGRSGPELATFTSEWTPQEAVTLRRAIKVVPHPTSYTYTGEPQFTIAFPPGTDVDPPTMSGEVYVGNTPDGVKFAASVADIADGLSLGKVADFIISVGFAAGFGSDYEVTENRPITLADGTPAYRSEIAWTYAPAAINFNTQVVAAFKDGKVVWLIAHEQEERRAHISELIESLRFD